MKHMKKSTALLVSLLLILSVMVGGTIAFLMDTSGPLENLVSPAHVSTDVDENLETPGVKKNVKIQNTGDIDAWVRAAVVVTWQNDKDEVYGKAPVSGTDYEISWGAGWLTGDDEFFYWPDPVKPNGCTGNLIESCTSKNTAPDGYYLTVEVICAGIQSRPASVFGTAWVSSGLVLDDADTDPGKWKLVEEVSGNG